MKLTFHPRGLNAWVTAGSFAAIATATVIGNWLRVQNVDPQYTAVLIERTMRFGGSYYDNGIHNRGPLEPFVYDLAARLTPANGFWYAISGFVVVIAVILAIAAGRTAIRTGATPAVGLSVGAVVFVHFTLSNADYAGVVYIRNLTTCLLAVAWLVIIEDTRWTTPRRRWLAAIAIGGALGLAVQSLIATIPTSLVVGTVAMMTAQQRVDREQWRRLTAATIGAAIVAFSSAPIWYLARGRFDEYWSGSFVYARFMSVGTGRSLGNQLGLGWDRFYEYYQNRPLAFCVVLAFVTVTGLGWSRRSTRWRLLHGGLVAWFAASWLELALSHRYSSHYFSLSSVPTALMAAALAGHVFSGVVRQRPLGRTPALPLAAAVIALYLSGFGNLRHAVDETRDFRGWNAHAVAAAKHSSGQERTVRGILDLVSDDGDPLLAWTQHPSTYLNSRRVAATRFIWKSFLLGEIYLGRTSNAYVLPDTWRWFFEDIDEAQPRAFYQDAGPVTASPFQSYVEMTFTRVATYGDNASLALRNDLAQAVLKPSAHRRWADRWKQPSRSGWTTHGNSATFHTAELSRDSDILKIAADSCFRLEGSVDTAEPGRGAMVFRFDDNGARHERLRLALEGDRVVSGSDFVAYLEQPSDLSSDGATDFALVVGRRSAALVVNGLVRAALELPASVSVSVEAHRDSLELNDLRLGAPPPGSGCGSREMPMPNAAG